MNESNNSDEWISKTSLEDFVKLKINNPKASLDEKDFYKRILKELKQSDKK